MREEFVEWWWFLFSRSIVAMLHQRQKDLEFRAEVYEKIQKIENEKINLNQNIDRLANQKRSLEQEVNNLTNKNKLLEKTSREEK
jgi:cell division protein FtsB